MKLAKSDVSKPAAPSASAKKGVVVRQPASADERPVTADDVLDEPDWLTRSLSSDKWPRFMVRYPRWSGVLFLAVSGVGIRGLARVAAEGGWYHRALPAAAAFGITNGLYLLVFGRPANSRGHSPEWWNIGWTVATVLGLALAIFLWQWIPRDPY